MTCVMIWALSLFVNNKMLTIPFKTLNKYNKKIRHFGSKSRIETMTDLVFLSDNLLVCANLSDKILHLIEFNYDLNTHKIIHSLDIPHHPDLIEICGNTIYVVNLNEYLTICEVVNNKKLILKKNTLINYDYQYHGVCVNPNNIKELFLASTRKYNIMTLYHIESGVLNNFVIPKLENRFLKDLIFIDSERVLILGSDNGPKPDTIVYTSYLNLYKYSNGKFTFLDGLTYKDCHMDAVVYVNGRYFVTVQLKESGCMLTGTIESDFIIPMENIPTDDFPHGLAITPSKKYIGHTCYSTGTVNIELLDSFW